MGKQGLGEFELMVLLAAIRLGQDEAYAVSIGDDIERHTGRAVQPASVYVTLQRLEEKGMVTSRMGDPLPERGGRARRLVRVEPEGIAAVRAARTAFTSMWKGLGPMLDER
jgi:PadR family transcriptional regulator, regulatory protein PadR